MSTTTFVGAKGGVGTSTVAALHALELARHGQTVRLTANEPPRPGQASLARRDDWPRHPEVSGVDDLATLLGLPTLQPGEVVNVVPGLTLAGCRATTGHNVVDAGTDVSSDHSGTIYVVLRNDYLSLLRAHAAPRRTAGVVLVTDSNHALGRGDITNALHLPIVAELAMDPAIARAIDDGQLTRHRGRLNLPTPPESVR